MISIDELRALNGKVSYHAMGVVKLRVNFDEFWHFYSDRTPIPKGNTHSHPYAYESKILFGGVRHYICDVVSTTKETQHNYQARIGRVGTPLTVIHDNINIIESATFDTYKNDTYYINHSTLHKIEPLTRKCVTYLKAEPWQDKLYFVVDKNKTHTRKEVLTQRASRDECWEIIEYTLDDEDNC